MATEDFSVAEYDGQVGNDRNWTRFVRWWPLGMGPIAMVFVYGVYYAGHGWLASRSTHEVIAPGLLLVPLSVFAVQALVYRSEFHLFMGCLCAALFCRELHFAGTSAGIYIALVVLGVWWAARGKFMEAAIASTGLRVWLIGTGACYLLSQVIARRVFRYLWLPREDELHVYLEETVETMAHLMLLSGCFLLWRTGQRAVTRKRRVVGAGGAEANGRRSI